jgi:phosphoglycerate dehydrogenase-like enzyme
MKLFSQVRPAVAAKVSAALAHVEVVSIPSEGELDAGLAAEVLLTYPWGSPNLRQVLARGVRWVHVLGTGIDAFPLEHLDGQALTCSRGASAVPIAEWVLAVMLAFEKRLPESWIHGVPATTWGRAELGGLHGRTLGLLGLGGIALAVAHRALSFGMRVRAYRRNASAAAPEGIEVVGSLAQLAASADHLVIAAPLTAATRHIVGRELLAALPRGAHLVNVARGGLVDQDALRTALDGGQLAMASLDAVDPEPLPAGHWLFTHPRVRLSPHVSWSMPGAADVLIEPFIDNLRRYQAGEPLAGLVDVKEGY